MLSLENKFNKMLKIHFTLLIITLLIFTGCKSYVLFEEYCVNWEYDQGYPDLGLRFDTTEMKFEWYWYPLGVADTVFGDFVYIDKNKILLTQTAYYIEEIEKPAWLAEDYVYLEVLDLDFYNFNKTKVTSLFPVYISGIYWGKMTENWISFQVFGDNIPEVIINKESSSYHLPSYYQVTLPNEVLEKGKAFRVLMTIRFGHDEDAFFFKIKRNKLISKTGSIYIKCKE